MNRGEPALPSYAFVETTVDDLEWLVRVLREVREFDDAELAVYRLDDGELAGLRLALKEALSRLPGAGSVWLGLCGDPASVPGVEVAQGRPGGVPRVTGVLSQDLASRLAPALRAVPARLGSREFGHRLGSEAERVEAVAVLLESGSAAPPQRVTSTARDEAPQRDEAWYSHAVVRAMTVLAPGSSAVVPIGPVPSSLPVFDEVDDVERWLNRNQDALRDAVVTAWREGRDEAAWRLADALDGVYGHMNWLRDWKIVAKAGLRAARRAGDPVGRAAMHEMNGNAFGRSGDQAAAVRNLRAACDLREEAGDTRGVLACLNSVGVALLRAHEPEHALTVFHEVHDRAVADGQDYWADVALANIACAHLDCGEPGQAVDLLPGLVAVHEARNRPLSRANALHSLSRAYRESGRPDAARVAIDTALDIADALHNRAADAFWLIEAGHVHVASEEFGQALACYHRSAVAHRRLHNRGREAQALTATARVHIMMDRPRDAEEFLRVANRLFFEADDPYEVAATSAMLAGVYAQLGDSAKADDMTRRVRILTTELDAASRHLLAAVGAESSRV